MDEARRFLRYLLPGLLYGIVTLGLLAIALPSVALDIVTGLKGKENFGFLLTMFFASGAVGFLFSAIHHCCHWYVDSRSIDHTEFSQHFKSELPGEANAVPVTEGTTSWWAKRERKRQEREEAFMKLVVLWYTRLQPNTVLSGADKKTASLGDLAHAHGTARIASTSAILTVQIVCIKFGHLSFDLLSIVSYIAFWALGLFTVFLFWNSYCRTSRIAQRVIEGTLAAVLSEEVNRENCSAKTHQVDRELGAEIPHQERIDHRTDLELQDGENLRDK